MLRMQPQPRRQRSSRRKPTSTRRRRNIMDFVRTAYMAGPTVGTTGALLTASDPQTLLQRGDFTRYMADHQLGVLADLDKKTVDKSNADAKARGGRTRSRDREEETRKMHWPMRKQRLRPKRTKCRK